MTENNAQVEVRTEFTVLTPGGGEMYNHNGDRDLRPKVGDHQWVATFRHKDQAEKVEQQLTEALRVNGIHDHSYSVASRTITTVTSEWSVVPND